MRGNTLTLSRLYRSGVSVFVVSVHVPVVSNVTLLRRVAHEGVSILVVILSTCSRFRCTRGTVDSHGIFRCILGPVHHNGFYALLRGTTTTIHDGHTRDDPSDRTLCSRIHGGCGKFLVRKRATRNVTLIERGLRTLPRP